MKRWSNNDLSIDIRQQWVKHIGGPEDINAFPRDLGFPHRNQSANSIKDMIEKVEKQMTHRNCYVQVFSDIEQMGNVYDTCYIDIDAEMPFEPDEGTKEERYQIWEEKLKDAHWEVKKYVWHIDNTYDAKPRVYFSGGRGFSLYVDFEEIQCEFGAISSTVKQTLKDADVDMTMVDNSVFEKNRISRLPYTLNWNNEEKRGIDPLMCVPIDPMWDFETILSEIYNPTIQKEVEIDRESNMMREYISHRDRTGDFESGEIDVTDADINPGVALERVQVLMDIAEHIGDGRSRILHFMLVPALIEAGWSNKAKIHEVCENFISKTGAAYRPEYHKKVEVAIDRTLEGPQGTNTQWKPWTIQTFLKKNPELLPHFDGSVLS